MSTVLDHVTSVAQNHLFIEFRIEDFIHDPINILCTCSVQFQAANPIETNAWFI